MNPEETHPDPSNGRDAREAEEQARFDARLRDAILAQDADTAALEGRIRESIRRGGSRKWIWAASSIAAALVLALAAYEFIQPPNGSRVYAVAAQDHRREVVDRQRRVWISDPGAMVQLAASHGLPADIVEALETIEGYRLNRAKLCRLDGDVYLHMVYSDGQQEFSVFLHEGGAKPGDGIQRADIRQEHVAAVQGSRCKALIVTEESSEAALLLARRTASLL